MNFRVNITRNGYSFLKHVKENDIVLLGGGHHFAHKGNAYYWRDTQLKDTGGDINIEAYKLTLTQLLKQLKLRKFTGHVILQTYSPNHFFHGDWDSHGNCEGYKEPNNDFSSYKNLGSLGKQRVEETNSMLRSLAKQFSSQYKVSILDITDMSWGRADAHPGGEATNWNDCAHWCLPGVPDTWNR